MQSSVVIYMLVFGGMVLLCLHTYMFYPFVASILSKKKRRYEKSVISDIALSVIIAAYNEEKVIAERIKNLSAQDYDLSHVEVLVGSDCSSDATNEILDQLEKEYSFLRVFKFTERRGKAGVVNDLVSKAKNDILVFTDANTEFDKNVFTNLVKGFSDNKVGGVSGHLELLDYSDSRKKGVEETSYWKFEKTIKESEGKLGVLIGANGGIFAIRRSLYRELPLNTPVTDDLFQALNVLEKGYEFRYNSSAIAYEYIGKDVKAEYRRKVRFSATNFQTLKIFRGLLLNKNILLSFCFFSHKVLRWFFPVICIFLFLVNIFLANKGLFLFQISLGIIGVFFLMSILGYLASVLKINCRLFSLPYFFVVANLALFHGLFLYLRRKHSGIWQSTER